VSDAAARLRPSVLRRKRAVKKERLRGASRRFTPCVRCQSISPEMERKKFHENLPLRNDHDFSYLRCGARIRVSIALEDSGYRKVKQHAGGTPHASWSPHGAADAVIMLPRPMDIVISKRVPSISHLEANLLKEFHGDGQNWHPMRPLWT
jgi:hypothetical protein